MRRTVCIDSKRHTHLSDGYIEILHRSNTGIGIQHLDLSFVRQIDFSLVTYQLVHLTVQTDTGITYLKALFIGCCLVFILATYRSMDIGQIILPILCLYSDGQGYDTNH